MRVFVAVVMMLAHGTRHKAQGLRTADGVSNHPGANATGDGIPAN